MAQRQTPGEKYADLLELAKLKQSAEYKSIQRDAVVDSARNKLHAQKETRKDRITTAWDDKVSEADHVLNLDESVLRRVLSADKRMDKLSKAMDIEDSPKDETPAESPVKVKAAKASKSAPVQTGLTVQ